MLCDNCRERDAVIQVTQVTEPPVKQLNLCEKCAAERGIETQLSVPKQPLTDFILAVQQKALPSGEADGVLFFAMDIPLEAMNVPAIIGGRMTRAHACR